MLPFQAETRPKAFLLENVVGLTQHDDGKTLARMLGLLSDAGYDVYKQIIDAGLVLPQVRRL